MMSSDYPPPCPTCVVVSSKSLPGNVFTSCGFRGSSLHILKGFECKLIAFYLQNFSMILPDKKNLLCFRGLLPEFFLGATVTGEPSF